jgi:hypothetical protein
MQPDELKTLNSRKLFSFSEIEEEEETLEVEETGKTFRGKPRQNKCLSGKRKSKVMLVRSNFTFERNHVNTTKVKNAVPKLKNISQIIKKKVNSRSKAKQNLTNFNKNRIKKQNYLSINKDKQSLKNQQKNFNSTNVKKTKKNEVEDDKEFQYDSQWLKTISEKINKNKINFLSQRKITAEEDNKKLGANHINVVRLNGNINNFYNYPEFQAKQAQIQPNKNKLRELPFRISIESKFKKKKFLSCTTMESVCITREQIKLFQIMTIFILESKSLRV